MKRLGVTFYDDTDIEYRGTTSSGKLKKIFDSLKQSILRCYVRAQHTTKEIDSIYKAIYYQNATINNMVESTVFDINVQNTVGDERVVWRNFYDGSAIISGPSPEDGTSNNVNISSKYGQLTLNTAIKTSKIKVTTNSLGVKKPSLSTRIFLADASTTINPEEVTDRDNEVYNILDGEGKTFWINDYMETNRIALDVVFQQGLSTKTNVITVDPFPFNVVAIKSIQYKPTSGLSFRNISIPQVSNMPSNDSAPIKIHFNPVDYGNEIRIILETKSKEKNVFGLSDLNVEYVEYVSSGHIYDDLVIPESDNAKVIDKITSFTPYYTVDTPKDEYGLEVSEPIKFQLMTTSGSVMYDSIENREITLDNQVVGFADETTIRVKTMMKNIGNTTPVLRGYRLTYTIK